MPRSLNAALACLVAVVTIGGSAGTASAATGHDSLACHAAQAELASAQRAMSDAIVAMAKDPNSPAKKQAYLAAQTRYWAAVRAEGPACFGP